MQKTCHLIGDPNTWWSWIRDIYLGSRRSYKEHRASANLLLIHLPSLCMCRASLRAPFTCVPCSVILSFRKVCPIKNSIFAFLFKKRLVFAMWIPVVWNKRWYSARKLSGFFVNDYLRRLALIQCCEVPHSKFHIHKAWLILPWNEILLFSVLGIVLLISARCTVGETLNKAELN